MDLPNLGNQYVLLSLAFKHLGHFETFPLQLGTQNLIMSELTLVVIDVNTRITQGEIFSRYI